MLQPGMCVYSVGNWAHRISACWKLLVARVTCWWGGYAKGGNVTADHKYSLCSKDRNVLKHPSDSASVSFKYQMSLPTFFWERTTLFQYENST